MIFGWKQQQKIKDLKFVVVEWKQQRQKKEYIGFVTSKWKQVPRLCDFWMKTTIKNDFRFVIVRWKKQPKNNMGFVNFGWK